MKIDLQVTRATSEIVLNSKEIDVQNAEILGKDGTYTYWDAEWVGQRTEG